MDLGNPDQFPIMFASFVAGKKAEGPGARVAQPTGVDIDAILGTEPAEAESKLYRLLKPPFAR